MIGAIAVEARSVSSLTTWTKLGRFRAPCAWVTFATHRLLPAVLSGGVEERMRLAIRGIPPPFDPVKTTQPHARTYGVLVRSTCTWYEWSTEFRSR